MLALWFLFSAISYTSGSREGHVMLCLVPLGNRIGGWASRAMGSRQKQAICFIRVLLALCRFLVALFCRANKPDTFRA